MDRALLSRVRDAKLYSYTGMILSASNSSPCANDASLFRVDTEKEKAQKLESDKNYLFSVVLS